MSDEAEICKRAVSFHKALYKNQILHDQADDKAFLYNLPQVSKEANADIRAITEKSMECAKAAGFDGLPVDF